GGRIDTLRRAADAGARAGPRAARHGWAFVTRRSDPNSLPRPPHARTHRGPARPVPVRMRPLVPGPSAARDPPTRSAPATRVTAGLVRSAESPHLAAALSSTPPGRTRLRDRRSLDAFRTRSRRSASRSLRPDHAAARVLRRRGAGAAAGGR